MPRESGSASLVPKRCRQDRHILTFNPDHPMEATHPWQLLFPILPVDRRGSGGHLGVCDVEARRRPPQKSFDP